ncbi:MAG: hypothetical protein COB41_00380 [Proteobacteria bacterium]|nr:MAG: hypothetical protein COB41_00380 [Pseudomonadota bacterium]
MTKHPYIRGNCKSCEDTMSQRWYYSKSVCRKCHRRDLKNTPKVLSERAIKLELKKNPMCWDCSSVNSSRWYKNHTQCSSCQKSEYIKKNYEKIKDYSKKWRIANKASICLYKKEYRDKTGYHRFAQAKRNAILKNAMPSWVDTVALKTIYKNCPKGYSVDHIIPLKSDIVCGLHVPCNLQYLTISENSFKWNKFDLTYENKGYKCQ